jgi:tetratricopeptide (TPR) repeat protein
LGLKLLPLGMHMPHKSRYLTFLMAISMSVGCRTTLPKKNKDLLDGASIPSPPNEQPELDDAASAADPSSMWSPASRRSFAMYHFLVAEKAAMQGDNSVAEEHFESSYNLDPNSFTGSRLARAKILVNPESAEGLTEARRMALLYPLDAHLRLLYGQALLMTKDLTESEVQLKKAIELDPKLDDAYVTLAKTYQIMGRSEKAIETARKLTQTNRSNPQGWTLLSRALLSERRPKEALDPARRAWELRESDPELALIYALTLDLNKRGKDAVKLYEQLYRFNPGNSDLIQRMVALYKDLGNLETALSLIDEMIDNSRDEVPGLSMQKVIILWELDRNLEAQKILSALDKELPESDRVSFMYAIGLLKVGQHQQSADRFAAIHSESPLKPEAMKQHAVILKAMGRVSEALTVIKSLTERSDADVSGYLLWAEILGDARNYAESVQVIDIAIKRFPENQRLMFIKGAYLEKNGDRKGAELTMRKIIDINGKDAAALNFLGYMLAEDGRDLDEAESLVHRALKIEPNNGGYIDSLGWIYVQKKMFRRAIQTLEKALELEPEEGVIWEHAGDALMALGEKTNALSKFKEALKRKNEPRDQDRIQKKYDDLLSELNGKG